MTNKTIIFSSAIAIALVAGVVSSGMLAEAAPQPKPPDDVFVTNDVTNAVPVTITNLPVPNGDSISKTIELKPVGGKTISIEAVTEGTNLLYHGSELCQITWGTQNPHQFYIEFATTTTVLDQGACGQPSAAINLVNGDSVFQPGDFLILQGVAEVYRQQTP